MGATVVVDALRVVARAADGSETTIVKDVSFVIEPGEVLALIGESGSGKTTIGLSLLGYARRGCRIAGGTIRIGGIDILSLPDARRRELRGRRVAYIAQSAAASFNPSRTIMDQVVETAHIHSLMPRQKAERKAIDLFRELALPSPESIGLRYPHQVSGGQLQRLMAAMALMAEPDLVILDEPTTALDVTTQIEVLHAFRRVVRKHGTTAVYVTHDLPVVAQMADRILVLRDGQQREIGTAAEIVSAPREEYTKSLIAAATIKAPSGAMASADAKPVLEISNLYAGYGAFGKDGRPAVPVLDNVSLRLNRGQAIGVIGESGSGKTTLARVVAGLVAPAGGRVVFDGQPLPALVAQRSREQLRRIQIVFQMADTALNPSHTVGDILARPLQLLRPFQGDALQRRIAQLLDLVQLPASCAKRLPSGLSGGQKQRVNLARALAAEPDLILCDEVTSALDTVVGATIIELLGQLRRELGVSLMFISHDLNTVRAVCDEIVVLYAGQKVESLDREVFTRAARHPYFHMLASSVPELRLGWLDEVGAAQRAPLPAITAVSPSLLPGLCSFLERCPLRIPGRCDAAVPPRRVTNDGVEVLCHRSTSDLVALQQPNHSASERARNA